MPNRSQKPINGQTESATHNLCSTLTLLMEQHQLDDAHLSTLTGIPAPTIARLRNNPNANPTASSLRPIAKFFNISISQLLGDEPLTAKTHTPTPSSRYVPVIEWSQVKRWKTEHNELAKQAQQQINCDSHVSPQGFALSIDTDAYRPLFQRGSILIVDPEQQPTSGDYAITKLADKSDVLFKQILIDGDDWYLKSVNPELSGIIHLEDRPEFMGMVVETRLSFQSSTIAIDSAPATETSLDDSLIEVKIDR